MFYKKRPIYRCIFLLPMYLLPCSLITVSRLLNNIINTMEDNQSILYDDELLNIIGILTVIHTVASIFLYLLTEWFITIKLKFCYTQIEIDQYIKNNKNENNIISYIVNIFKKIIYAPIYVIERLYKKIFHANKNLENSIENLKKLKFIEKSYEDLLNLKIQDNKNSTDNFIETLYIYIDDLNILSKINKTSYENIYTFKISNHMHLLNLNSLSKNIIYYYNLKVSYNLPINKYIENNFIPKLHTKESNQNTDLFKDIYPSNTIRYTSTSFSFLLKNAFTSPIFIFQLFSGILWMFDDYFYHSLINLILTVLFELGGVYQKYCNYKCFDINKNIENVNETVTKLEFKDLKNVNTNKINLDKMNKVIVNVKSLKPGDMILLDNENDNNFVSKMGDCLLLNGEVIVNESVLTGESVPVVKKDVYSFINLQQNDVHKKNTLYSNVQGENKNNTEDSCITSNLNMIQKKVMIYTNTKIINHTKNSILLVINTGHYTENGSIINNYINSTALDKGNKTNTKNNSKNNNDYNNNTYDSLLLILYMTLIGFMSIIYIVHDFIYQRKFEKLLQKHFKECCFEYFMPDLKKIADLLKNIADGNELNTELTELIFFRNSIKNLNNNHSKYGNYKLYLKFILNCLLLLTNIIPPELPLELTMALNNAIGKLMLNKIYCLDTNKLSKSSSVDVIAFDKTGTITEDEIYLKHAYINYKFINKNNLNNSSLTNLKNIEASGIFQNIILSSCTSITTLNRNTRSENKKKNLLGDPMDLAIQNYFDLDILDNNSFKYKNIVVKKEKCFEFESNNRRMTVVIKLNVNELKQAIQLSNSSGIQGSNNKTYHNIRDRSISNEFVYVSVMKGAPEEIKKHLKNIPSDYDNNCKKYMEDGYRVLSVGYKILSKPFKNEAEFLRYEIEKECSFGGFLLFENPIKPFTNVLIKLLDSRNIKNIMITGDSKLTAEIVANKIGIIKKSDDKNKSVYNNEEIKILINKIENDSTNKKLLDEFRNIKVFTRASPSVKEDIIKVYKNYLGNVTMMVGDGCNDIGALQISDVGVALLNETKSKKYDDEIIKPRRVMNQKQKEAQEKIARLKSMLGLITLNDGENDDASEGNVISEASMSAPFSTRFGLEAILHILDYGKSIHITVLQMFKILSLNSIIFGFSLVVLDKYDVKYGEYQLIGVGILISLAFMFLTDQQVSVNTEEENDEEDNKKTPAITSYYMYTSITLQALVHTFALYFLFRIFANNSNTLINNELYVYDYLTNYRQNNINQEGFCHICNELKENLTGVRVDEMDMNIINTSNNNSEGSQEVYNIDSVRTKFKPSISNTIMFIASSFLQIVTFFVNYVGRPYRENLVENKKLLFSLVGCVCLIVTLLFGISDDLSESMECVKLSWGQCFIVLNVLMADWVLCWIVERSCISFLVD